MLERLFSKLGAIEDKATEMEGSVLKPILKRRGIDVVLTRSSEERINFLTEIFRYLNEGGDDGDLDELAESLIRSGVVPPPGVEISRIRVKKVPAGPAPAEVRRSWVGTEMLAVKLLPWSGEELNFVTNESMPARDAYAVLSQPAVDALRGRFPKAAE